MNSTWDNVYQKRWDWAHKAEKEFKQSLQKLQVDEAIHNDNPSEITIGVYGPTQVGKSTLILRLLGIRQDSIETVSNWLRGKRTPGHSATVTATEYRLSQDEYFHFFSKETGWKRNLTGPQMEQTLFEIRSDVEAKGQISTDQLVIEISNLYFDSEIPAHGLNLVDLPGVYSAEAAEQRQVRECVERWLPICEIILLVEDATVINNYVQLEDESVKYWMNETDRFRLVPTHSASLESVQKELSENLTIETLKNYYTNELFVSLEGKLETDEISSILYPIEMGRSLETLMNSDQRMYEKVADLMEELLQALRNDLSLQKAEAIHYKRLASLYRLAEEKKKEEIEENRVKVESVKKHLKKHRNFVRQLRERNKKLDAKNTASKSKPDMKNLRSFFTDWETDLQNSFVAIRDTKRASAINALAASFQHEWEDLMKQQVLALNIELEEWGIELMPPVTDHYIEFVYTKMDAYLIPKNYKRDLEMVLESTWKWMESYIKSFERVVSRAESQLEEMFKKELLLNAAKKKRRDIELQDGVNKLQKLTESIEALSQKLVQAEVIWQEDIEHCQQLEKYFSKNALQAFHSLKSTFINGTDVEKWQAFHLLHLLKEDSKTIISYVKGKE
jgi:GTPase SAR1 family protein